MSMESTSKGRNLLLPVGSVRKSLPFTDATKLDKWGMLLYILVVGHAVFDHRAGNEVLQFVLIPFVEGFELVVDVHYEVLSYIGERVLLLRIYLAV